MKDLSLMDHNRRLKGMGKSKLGEQTGTFDIHINGNRNQQGRKAVCIIRKQQGWESLTLSIKHRIRERLAERPPTPDEVRNILQMFFEPWETPVHFVKFPISRRDPFTFWLSERTNQAFSHLPR